MAMLKVKWGKETYQVEMGAEATVLDLKARLEQLTSVPAAKQKIMGLKPAAAHGDAKLIDVGATDGKAVMLIGTAEGIAVPTVQAAPVESSTGGHSQTSTTSNGLNNIANTCYMNSALQLLRTMPEVKECVAKYTGSNPFLQQLGALFSALDDTKDAVTPFSLWTSLVQINPAFGERDDHGMFMQHDAQEVLSVMLQQIQDALPTPCAKVLKGSLQQKLTCTEDTADTGRETEVPFTMLTCNIAGEVQTLEAGLEQAFNEKFNARSDTLQRDASFTKMSRVSVLPEYLIVHIVRFSWKGDIQKKAKILKPISFPVTLDMFTLLADGLRQEQKPYRDIIMQRRDKELEKRKRRRGDEEHAEEESQDVPDEVPAVLENQSGYYELCGVISHKGRSADGGHYVYWGKKADQWLIYDDQHVGAVTEDDVKRLRGVGEAHIAYVLLYRSRDPLTHRPVLPL